MKNDLITYTTPETYYSIGICELMLKSPHILIGGTTGAGKSVLIENLIYTIMSKYTPHDARFFFIDPKRVTFTKYRRLPFTEQIETENGAILDLLNDLVFTMEKRYDTLKNAGLTQYDGKHIFIIIDEIADLMTTCKKEIVPLIQRIAQLGRASNIHLIVATQCPNRKIIPAELTVNFGGRVALRCLNRIESRQLINCNGAETLPQYGKCIYLHCDGRYYTGELPYMPDKINELINFWLKQGNNDNYFISHSYGDTAKRKNNFSILGAFRQILLGGSYIFPWEITGNKHGANYTPHDKKKKRKRDDIETLNILSIIDDD